MKKEKIKLLFICSRNKRRSLTAEKIFEKHPLYEVKSAGTADGARVKLTKGLIGWADCILVMEKRHKIIMQQKFEEILANKQIIVLDIADDYEYMDEELVETLFQNVKNINFWAFQ
jgi:predicted protein tyrosine phosphatase